MQLAKSISLRNGCNFFKIIFSAFFVCLSITGFSQDNSPYSRYGLGNEFPKMNVGSRGMGGVSAAYSDIFSVNFNNPASYSNFLAILEPRSQKLSSGRVVLDVGLNITSRTLTTPNTPQSFTSSDALFSHVYVGVPLRKNWGLAFGLRPLSRINYNVFRRELLRDPSTNLPIDSAVTQFTGTGGSFLPSIGTGFGIGKLNVGVNVGYLFGRKELSTRRVLINDTVEYAASNHTSNTSFGNVFFNAGAQYRITLNDRTTLSLGVTGNWKQKLNATRDLTRQTYTRAATGEELVIDSVSTQTDIPGEIIYPASYTGGFIVERAPGEATRGFAIGADLVQNRWDDFRFFGAKDSVRNNWELRVGTQLGSMRVPSRYAQAVSYRFGFFVGQDYIHVQNNLPVFGLTFGMGLPIVNYNRLSPNQYSILNLGLEFTRRGNDENLLKENLFRLSLGFNFTDLWFGKRKYD
ncbi:MAG TPA: hypothetical protein VM368_06235 [Flavisolibacter sp.]|nr:hypothetical protein [Flavisolibacter sp.]